MASIKSTEDKSNDLIVRLVSVNVSKHTSDNELPKESQNCHSDIDEFKKKLLMKQNLLVLNEKNNKISKSLTKVKREYENLKSDLQRELFFISVETDKRKILYEKKLKDFLEKKMNLEISCRSSSNISELEELINTNKILIEEYNKITAQYELTKREYNKIMMESQENFQRKVCEFCNAIIILKKLSNREE